MKNMGQSRKFSFMIILATVISCQNNHSFQLSQELGALTPTSARPETIYKTCDKKNNICIEMNTIDGSRLQLHQNKDNNTFSAQGEIIISDSSSGKKITQNIDLEGTINDDGKIHLRPMDDGTSEYKVRAAVTCKDKNENGSFDCNDVLIDLIAKKNDRLFSTQLETNLNNTDIKSPKILTSPSPSPSPSPKPTTTEQAPKLELINDSEGSSDSENSGTEDAGVSDRYVGASFEELKKLTELSPAPKKTAAPSKSTKEKDPQPVIIKNSGPSSEPKKSTPPISEPSSGAINKGAEMPESPSVRCKNSFLCDDQGKILRPIDQAYGSPEKNNGRLTNASNLFDFQNLISEKAHFEVRKPQESRHFLTYELMIIIHQTADYIQNIIPNFKLAISDCSKKDGGKLSPHLSHRNGLDVDIPYILKNTEKAVSMKTVVSSNKLIPEFDLESQWKAFKFLVKTDKVDRIFLHKLIKKSLCQSSFVKSDLAQTSEEKALATETLRRLRIRESDHADHFHLRVKCSAYDRRCQQSLPPAEGLGC